MTELLRRLNHQWMSDGDRNAILNEIYLIADSANDALNLCRDCGDVDSTPPILELQGIKDRAAVCDPSGKCDETQSPAIMQFCDLLSWNSPENIPDPGQLVNLLKYFPVDMLQVMK